MSQPSAPPEVQLGGTPINGEFALTMDGIIVSRRDNTLLWMGDMSIDADGSPWAYHPRDMGKLNGREPLGLDAPENAGNGRGKWWGVATKDGVPIVQGPNDPAPGYWVSTTALGNPAFPSGDQRRYVDSARIPYIAVPPALRELGVKLGDLALVRANGKQAWAQVADVGPQKKLGEGSIALAVALGLVLSQRMLRNAAAKTLGLSSYSGKGSRASGVAVTVYMGSTTGRPLSPEEAASRGEELRGAGVA